MNKLSDNVLRTFTNTIDINDLEILTEDGFVDINQIHQTIPYTVYRIELEDGYYLECADNHIVIDKDLNEIFVKDSLGKYLITITGYKKVIYVNNLNYEESMYDLSLNSSNQTYFSNGILSHNTTTASIILLHYALFNDAKRIAILSNKESSSIDVLERIQMAYENLPLWMQRGVKTWNKKSVEFENESKIIAAATSSSSIRGKAVAFLYVDECVRNNTKIWILEISSNIEYEISIGELYKKIETKEIEFDKLLIKENFIYKIKTPRGYVDFKGIKKSKTDHIISVKFSDGKYIECSDSHSIKHIDDYLYIYDLKIGDYVNDAVITEIQDLDTDEYVYDLLDVEGYEYFTNGLISHNCAFIENWTDFYASTYPTISSGKTTKLLFSSTPFGLNHYYDFWKNATEGFVNSAGEIEKSGFIPISAPWDRLPSRDEKWKNETLAALNWDYDRFAQEYQCIFGEAKITVQNEEGYIYEISLKNFYDGLE